MILVEIISYGLMFFFFFFFSRKILTLFPAVSYRNSSECLRENIQPNSCKNNTKKERIDNETWRRIRGYHWTKKSGHDFHAESAVDVVSAIYTILQ